MERVGRRVEADVARDRPPVASRAGRPGRRRVEDAAPLELVEQAGAGPAARRAVTGARRRGVSDREAAYERSFTDPMLSCGLRCRPPSRGGSAIDARCEPPAEGARRIDRPSHPHRHPHHPPPRQPAHWPGRVRCSPWPRTTTTRQGLPDPKDALTDLDFEQQTIVYDRTGKVELARLGTLRRELVDVRRRSRARCSTRRPRSRTRTSGSTRASTRSASSAPAWTRSRGRPRGASTITQQLVRERLLPAEAFEGTTYERKVREIIQSIRLTEAYPGEDGQAGDHHRLPEPQLLRQPTLRREGRGQGLLRQEARGPDARPVRDPRRDPAVADEVRPDPQRRGGLPRRGRSGSGAPRSEVAECKEVQLVVPDTTRDRPAPELHPRPDEDAQPADRRRSTPPPSTRPPSSSRS